ncbi:Bug family tripartite tricarboxylate transporter substrate binding protein [Hydrogenophaga sp. BPS33]|uniref:Bug family tripartite tricarboxylate transporter substrate binding protein n=1 Tax=Hydrogenophaga sp. BPS33 TaxID=2651974 RepID=UPI00131FE328|nr:tripartite tricarboxylate transporter substrate binding protein [Hydrogenophaga sp. BPS33]QHE87514.1 tripartite tricarboxylate transporter substrate binding protein [Hydrogenophaga sp. BPS33]
MNRIRRILLSWAAMSMLSMSALAQSDFPRKPVTLVNPYPPGGLADSTARQLAQRLSTVWGQSVVVDTKPGAAGNLAAQAVINAPADGYTLLFTIPEALSITKASGVKVGFDPAADLEPVALVALSTTVLIVPANSPHGSFKAFMEHAAQQPGTLNFGSQGQGSSFHLALEQLKLLSKTQITHVPYKGAAAALTDLTAGRIDAMIATTQLALPNVQAGRVRVLAVTSGERLAQFPGAPTIAESGFAGFEYPVGLGVFVRHGTPVGLIQKINADVRKVMNEPSFVELLAKSATVTTDLGASEFKSRWVRETKGYSDLIRTSNIKFE